MKLAAGIRGRLFAVSGGVVVIAVLASGLYFRSLLRAQLEHRAEAEVARHARAASTVFTLAGDAGDVDLDRLVTRFAETTDTHLTLTDARGRVLADSWVAASATTSADSRASDDSRAEPDLRVLPEVAAALRRGSGQGRRRGSGSRASLEMVYSAVSFETPHGRRVVSVGRELTFENQTVDRLHLLLLGPGLVALLVAVIAGVLVSSFISRRLRRLVATARSISAGESDTRISVADDDGAELAGLAGSMNQLADEIEKTVAELADERARFRAVLEAQRDTVIALDRDNRVLLMNHSAYELLGISSIPIGESILSVLRAPALQELIAAKDTGSAEFDLPGTDRRLLAQVSPMQSGRVIVLQDVTKLRKLETVRRDFVANVSHELRTPISIVRANAETLLDGAMNDSEFGPRLLKATLRSSERLSAIVNDLLDLSRIEAGRQKLSASNVPVVDVVDRIVESSHGAAGERRITIENELPPGLVVAADSKALEQIVVNYLDNAIKYTPEGGSVRIEGSSHAHVVRIEVHDDGPGIEPRHRARVFERFYRVDPGRSRDMGGTGLGLSIVKHLAEAMGGRVGLEPAEPHGSIFWLELPGAEADSAKNAAG